MWGSDAPAPAEQQAKTGGGFLDSVSDWLAIIKWVVVALVVVVAIRAGSELLSAVKGGGR